MDMVLLTSIGAVSMAVLAMFIRMKAANHPVTIKKIILPPVFMSTGALMFIFPYFRVTSIELLEAVIVGALFSLILIKTTKFETKGSEIYLKKSKAFIFILISLLIIRLIAKLMLSSTIDVGALAGMFYLLAFAMIVPWRVAMFFQFRKMDKAVHVKQVESRPTT